MSEPNKYQLNKHVRSSDLKKQGFEYKLGTYKRKKMLNQFFYVQIEIDLDEQWMTYFVMNDGLDTYYLPFHLKEYRKNNSVYKKVLIEFNEFMDSLCKNNILWREGLKEEMKKPRASPRLFRRK